MTAVDPGSVASPAAGSPTAGPPPGRYGRPRGGEEARTDRRLKLLGGVLGVLGLAVLGWFGWFYVAGQDVSGELIKFKVVSDRTVEVHLEVRKDAGAEGVCTLRAQEESGAEVGRKSVRADSGEARHDSVVRIRTTRRATSAELTGCEAAAAG